jgi:hypothetical protein
MWLKETITALMIVICNCALCRYLNPVHKYNLIQFQIWNFARIIYEMYVIVTELNTLLKCTVKYCTHGRDIAPLLLPNQTNNVYMTKHVTELIVQHE